MHHLPDDTWYKNAIFYAIDVKVFQDSDGDGIGDFRGLIQRLDYLQDLGITCVWLLPFYPASGGDNGYDVTNHYEVDPRLGTLDDFINFVRLAGERGIRVITELVMNHTSHRHPWFQAARHARDSRFRDYYLWRDTPPLLHPEEKPAFPGQEHSVWKYDAVARAYYYHVFYSEQPDLNVSNPQVVQEMIRLMDYWLSFGVAGFRVDAAGVMIEKRLRDGALAEDPVQLLIDLRQTLVARQPAGILLGEADVPSAQLVTFFGSGGRLNMLLNFLLDQYLYLAFATEQAEPVYEVLEMVGPIPFEGQWMNFLRNLDELNLGKVPLPLRKRIYTAFAPEPAMRIYDRGIRRRIAPMFEGHPARVLGAFSLLFSLPGAPMFVYGDEIGMGENLSLTERNSVRTPMQWSAAVNGGFSTARPEALFRPAIAGGPYGYPRVNVAAQQDDPASLYHGIRELIRLRRLCPAIGLGTWDLIPTASPAVFAHRCDGPGETLLFVHNLSRTPVSLSLEIPVAGVNSLSILAGAAGCERQGDRCRISLDGYGFGWYRLESATAAKPVITLPAEDAVHANGHAPGAKNLIDLQAIREQTDRQTHER